MSNVVHQSGTWPRWPNRAAWAAQAAAQLHLLPIQRRQRSSSDGWLPASVLIASSGTLKVERGGLCGELPAGRAIVLEASASTTSVEADAYGHGAWIALRDTTQAHRALLSTSSLQLPAALISLALDSAQPRAGSTGLLEQLESWIADAQHGLKPLLERCPGRSTAHRWDVLTRLQRIKALLDIPAGPVLELAGLAAATHYSLSHFQRMFTRVYGISPIDHQRRCRLARARDLIATHKLSVREVAESVGFESRSTFNRLFRERYGNSAGRLRRNCASLTSACHPSA